jgi:hypothetical protein
MESKNEGNQKKLQITPVPALIRAPNKVKCVAYMHLKTLQTIGLRTGGLVRLIEDDSKEKDNSNSVRQTKKHISLIRFI